jgi:hypothetical protein
MPIALPNTAASGFRALDQSLKTDRNGRAPDADGGTRRRKISGNRKP